VEEGGSILIALGDGSRVIGTIDVQCALREGTGAAPPSNRLVDSPVRIASAPGCVFDGFTVQNARDWGLVVDGTVVGADLGDCTFRDCGIGWHPSRPHYGGKTALELVAREGAPGSPVQRSLFLRVGDFPIEDEAIVQWDTEFFQVCSGETVARELEAYPWVSDPAAIGVELEGNYWQGGGLKVSGGNTAQLRVRSLRAYRCAIGLHDRALYGVRVSAYTCEATGIGWVYGNQSPNAAPLGSVISGWHPEATYRAAVCAALKGRAWIEHTAVPVSRAGRALGADVADGYRLVHLQPQGGGPPWGWPFLSPEGA
jgi:hypothetical protein